jgi:hypothetical protein
MHVYINNSVNQILRCLLRNWQFPLRIVTIASEMAAVQRMGVILLLFNTFFVLLIYYSAIYRKHFSIENLVVSNTQSSEIYNEQQVSRKYYFDFKNPKSSVR